MFKKIAILLLVIPSIVVSTNLSKTESKIHLFLHACTIGNWEEVLERQFDLIVSSRLYEACESISIGVLGTGDISSFTTRHPKLTVLFQYPDISLYERPTLLALYQFSCTHPNVSIMYLHTKGVTRQGNANVTDWVKYLEYFIIERWKDCVAALKYNDLCGVNWQLEPKPHFSGNFWWANSNYISTLPNHINTQALNGGFAKYSEYLAPEMWVGQNSPKVRCFHHSHTKHYEEPYPESKYKIKSRKIFNQRAVND